MARSPKRKPLYPLPVDALFHHPEWIALPVAGRGILLSICEHFWKTRCRPLPRDDDQLFAIARAHRPTWRHHKPTIMALFSEIEPDLRAGFEKRERGRISFQEWTNRLRDERERKRLAARLEQSNPPAQPAILTAMPIAEPGARASQAPSQEPAPTSDRSRLRA